MLFNHTLVIFANYLIIEIYSLSKYIKKIGNREMGNLEIFVESRKLLYTTYELLLLLTYFLYHLGLEELGVQEFIDEKHFKGGKLIQII